MRRGASYRLAVVWAALVLAGCSSGTDTPTLYGQIFQAARSEAAARQAPKTPPKIYSRAELDRIEGSFLEVRREDNGQQAYLYAALTRRDGQPGKITVWRAADPVWLATRNGMLIATRGLGGDILSGTAPARGDTAGPAGGANRVFHIRGGENDAIPVAFSCTLADLGAQTIEIVGRRHATRHLREHCAGDDGQVVNDYWVSPDRRLVWQSRQWAGPQTGYLRLRRLIE